MHTWPQQRQQQKRLTPAASTPCAEATNYPALSPLITLRKNKGSPCATIATRFAQMQQLSIYRNEAGKAIAACVHRYLYTPNTIN